jgi:hypothetical protein
MLKILAILLVVGVFIYGWYRNDLRRLTRDHAHREPFDGALERCKGTGVGRSAIT